MRLVRSAVSVVTILLSSHVAATYAQATREFIAFRVDEQHIVAVIGDSDGAPDRVGEPPLARFGFSYGDADASTVARLRGELPDATRWTVHVAPDVRVSATATRFVHGSASCSTLAGLLLRVDAADAQRFVARPEKYFVAAPVLMPERLPAASPPSALPALERSTLESMLHDLLTRELPPVRDEAKTDIERFAASDVRAHRTWALERQRLDRGLLAGRARLHYDVQSFVLSPDGTPWYFVRAEWRVNARPAFGAALWIKDNVMPVIVDRDLTPARWLRMFEFQGRLGRERYGLVLNVIDRDGDGWRDVVFAHGGYEAMGIRVKAFRPGGVESTPIGYSFGC